MHYKVKILILLGFLVMPFYAYADTPIETYPSIQTNGNVTGTCNGSNIYGWKTFAGVYPDQSSPNTTNTANSLCSALLEAGNQSMEDGWANGTVPTVDGDYWVQYTQTGSAFSPDYAGTWYWWSAERIGGLWYASADTNTRFIEITPADKSVVNSASPPFSATSTATVTISADIYFNDVESGNYIDQVCTYLEKIDQGISPNNYGQTLVPVCEPIITSAESTVDMVFTNLAWGRYFAVVSFSNPAHENFQVQSFEFINQYTLTGGANQSCLFGEDFNGFCNDAEPPEGYGSTTPVAFRGIPLEDCTLTSWTEPLEKSFCVLTNTLYRIVNYLFVPDSFVWNTFVGEIKDNMLTHFPLGYFYDFITIMSTTTVGSLPTVDFHVPSILNTGEQHVILDPTGALDGFLYATTGVFFNSDISSSTETFYDITSQYWRWISYFLAFLYMLMRILGSHVIPFTKKETK